MSENVHALFVPAAGDEAPEVEWIVVRRQEAGGWVTAPRTMPAGEVPDLEALCALFGGGTYELVALAGPAHGRRETGRVRVTAYGAPLPLGAGLAAPVAAVAASGDGGMVQLLAAMMQGQTQILAALLSRPAVDPVLAQLLAQRGESGAGLGVRDVIGLVRELQGGGGGLGGPGGGLGEAAMVGLMEGLAAVGGVAQGTRQGLGIPQPGAPSAADGGPPTGGAGRLGVIQGGHGENR